MLIIIIFIVRNHNCYVWCDWELVIITLKVQEDPHPNCGWRVKNDDGTHAVRGLWSKVIIHIMRVSRESKVASKYIQKWLERAETGELAGGFMVVGWGWGESFNAWFKLPTGAKGQSTGLSYQLPQLWGRRSREGGWGLRAVSNYFFKNNNENGVRLFITEIIWQASVNQLPNLFKF